jgi:hypothetical protein
MFVFNGSKVIPFGYYPRPSRDRGRARFRSGLKGAFERGFENVDSNCQRNELRA